MNKLLSVGFLLAVSLLQVRGAETDKATIQLNDVMDKITSRLPGGAIYHFDHIPAKIKRADTGEEELIGYLDGFYDADQGKFLGEQKQWERKD